MKTVAATAVLCALLVATATGCGSGPAQSASADTVVPTQAAPSVAAQDGPPRSGERTPLGDGLTITLSTPKSFTPTDSALAKTPRALGFDVTVENKGATAYRSTSLALTAEVDGVAVRQVVDSTLGYSGVVGDDTVAPGAQLRFSVAFAMPERRVPLRITARPEPSAAAIVLLVDPAA